MVDCGRNPSRDRRIARSPARRPGRRTGSCTVATAYVGTMLDPNDRFASPAVRAVAAFSLPGTTTLAFPRAPLDESGWAELIDAVTAERLLGLLLPAITTGAFPVTPLQAKQVRELATDAVRYCLVLEGELLRAAVLLSAADVSLRVLKGPAAAALDYPDPTMRAFVDIDILIRSEEFDRAVETLTRAGYVREHPQPRSGFDRRFSKGTSFISPRGLALDVHRTFVMGPYGLKVHLDDLWAPGTTFRIAGQPFIALSAEARLLHACYHAALGDWPRRILPHRDIAQIALTGRYDESRFYELTKRWQAEAVVATSVALAWDLLGISDTNRLATWASEFVPSVADKRALDLYARTDVNYATLSLAALGAVKGVQSKAAYLRSLAFPERAYVVGRHRSRVSRVVLGLAQTFTSGRKRH